MAFVAITGLCIKIKRGSVEKNWSAVKATAVGFVTFHDQQTFQFVPEDCKIVDMFTVDNVNALDYLAIYRNGNETDRIYGGLLEISPAADRMSIELKKNDIVTMYWYSA